MESRSDNLESQKRKVLEFIETRGPSLPVRIATSLNADSLIIGAFLSELLNDKQLKISSMRVGNSPIYYMRGQEFQLENFSQYLGSKEREAFELLKEQDVLMDERLSPPIRVALRSLKDFAFAFEFHGKLFWRYIKVPYERAIEILESRRNSGEVQKFETSKIVQKEAQPILQRIKQAVLPQQNFQQPREEVKRELVERGIETNFKEQPFREQGVEIKQKENEEIEKPLENQENLETKKEIVEEINLKKEVEDKNDEESKPLLSFKKKKSFGKDKSSFVFEVIEFLEGKDFVIAKEIDFKKREYYAYLKVDSAFGKTMFYCMAKDKKSITDNDLNQALQVCYDEKMPVVLVSRGEPNKKAAEKLEEVGNLVFFLKMS